MIRMVLVKDLMVEDWFSSTEQIRMTNSLYYFSGGQCSEITMQTMQPGMKLLSFIERIFLPYKSTRI